MTGGPPGVLGIIHRKRKVQGPPRHLEAVRPNTTREKVKGKYSLRLG